MFLERRRMNLTIKEAAQLLGKTEQFVRLALQQRVVDFGFAVKHDKNYTYHISREKLNEYLGKEST